IDRRLEGHPGEPEHVLDHDAPIRRAIRTPASNADFLVERPSPRSKADVDGVLPPEPIQSHKGQGPGNAYKKARIGEPHRFVRSMGSFSPSKTSSYHRRRDPDRQR